LQVLVGLLWPELDAVFHGGGVHLQVLVGLLMCQLDIRPSFETKRKNQRLVLKTLRPRWIV
jgi:hypothetical protein